MNRQQIIIFSLLSLLIIATTIVYIDDDTSIDDLIYTAETIIDTSHNIISSHDETERNNLISKITGAAKRSDTFESIPSLNAQEKLNFLKQLYNSQKPAEISGIATDDIINDISGLSAILSLLALDNNERISKQSLSVINHLALATHSTDQAIDLSDFSQSPEIKSALDYLILSSDTDDISKALAIDAHSWLYPPDNTIISEFEKLIVAGNVDRGNTLSSIFDAFSKYKKLHDYDMPASILDATKKLIEHPLDSVKADALYQLSKNIGVSALPVLFDQLKINQSSSVVNRLIVDILFVDQSDETIRQLKEIASKSPGSEKARLIKNYTHPKSIERFKRLSQSQ